MSDKNNQNDNKSFWTTIPGFLAAIAAVITAIGGLITVLSAVGLFGHPSPTPTIVAPIPTFTLVQMSEVPASPEPAHPTTISPEVRDLTGIATASVSSVLAPEETVSFGLVHFDPGYALDRDPATSWVEGVAGSGIGEQLKLVFPQPISLTRLGVDIGFDRDESIFYANNRVRRVRLIFSDGSAQSADFLDQRGIQYVPIPNISTTSVVIVIEDVYRGSTYDDTPIAEVEVWGYASP
jgi:hypothetical protein